MIMIMSDDDGCQKLRLFIIWTVIDWIVLKENIYQWVTARDKNSIPNALELVLT